MVNEANMRLFVDELRSGRRQQGKGFLEFIDTEGVTRNCCLGVACRVAMDHGVDLQAKAKPLSCRCPQCGGMNELFGFNKHVHYLPPSVQEWLGINTEDPTLVLSDRQPATATKCNDTLKLSLLEIADAFERTFLTEVSHGE